MATLYITELQETWPVQAPLVNTIQAEQHVAIGMGSIQSAAFQPGTKFVMVNCDAACSLAWGTNPTAVATAQRMGANETRFYGVPVGKNWKLAVIGNS